MVLLDHPSLHAASTHAASASVLLFLDFRVWRMGFVSNSNVMNLGKRGLKTSTRNNCYLLVRMIQFWVFSVCGLCVYHAFMFGQACWPVEQVVDAETVVQIG